MSESTGVLATFVAYLILLGFIGWWGQRKHSKSYRDFVSADKSMGSLATALSAAASSESVWVMLGLSGFGYWHGIAALWAAIGCVAGFAFNAIFITVQLRRDSARLGSLTVSDYIEERLGDKTRILRVTSALLITFFMACYVVAQFAGSGKLFDSMEFFGYDPVHAYEHGVVLGAVIVGIYMFLGGYASVCWTDTVQGILMFFVMLGLPTLAVVEAGGFGGIADVLGPMGLLSMSGAEGAGWLALGFIVSQLAIGLGYPGMPHMIVRYMTVRDDTAARRAAMISVVWSTVVLFGSTLLGIAGRALYPTLLETEGAAEGVLPLVTREYLDPVLAGVVLSAVTAAIMSTADSQLMYAATSVINDLWLKVRKGKPLAEKTLVWTTRGAVAYLALVAMCVAIIDIPLIYKFVLFAWGGLGSAFGPIIILSLYWKRLTRWGALASLITGPAVTVGWYRLKNAFADDYTLVYELVPAFALSFIAAVVTSLLTWENEKENANPPG